MKQSSNQQKLAGQIVIFSAQGQTQVDLPETLFQEKPIQQQWIQLEAETSKRRN